jgi:ADP-ribose pyrophosphatase YjhB (NUDIX family)
MAYCVECGGAMAERIPPDDDRLRLVCPACGHIAYLNPKVVAGSLPVVDGKVLLLRRGIEPRIGTWTYPGGFLEMGETTEECAVREAREELGIVVDGLELLGVYSRRQAGVVTIVYLSELVGGEPRATPEALEAGYFGPGEIPWSELAFPTTVSALKDWAVLMSGRVGERVRG